MPPVSKPELVTALQDMEEQETKRKWRRASIVIQTALRGKLARRRNSNVAFDPRTFKGVVPASAADGGGGGSGSGSGSGGESKGDSSRGAASNDAAAKLTKILSQKLPDRDGNKAGKSSGSSGGKEGSTIVGEACGPNGDAKRRGIFSQMDADNCGAVSIQAFIDCLDSNKGLAERLGIPRTFVTQTPPDRLHDKIDEMFSPPNAPAKSRAGLAGITVRLFEPVLIIQ
jgi:hypothetical protein